MKKGITATIDEELWQIVKENKEINFSGLVNRLLWSYFSGGMDSSKAASETRIDALKHKREGLEREIQEIDAVLKAEKKRFEEASVKESDLDRDLGRFVTDTGRVKALTGLNYAYFRENYGLSNDELDEKLEEIAESQREK